MAVIKKENVSVERLSELLTSAAIEWSVDDDGDLFANRGALDWGVYLSLQDGYRLRLLTHIPCKEGVDSEELRDFVSDLNAKYVMVRFTSTVYDSGEKFINGDYDIFYTFGIDGAHLIHTLRKFATIFAAAIREEDKDDVFTA